MNKSLDIIHDEHRALAAMLGGMRTLVANIEAGRLKPDFDLFASMIRYVDEVPERVHHPKEDRYLFAKLRLRSPEALPYIEQLEAEHRQGEARIALLRNALNTYRQAGAAGLAGFKMALTVYLEHEWHHMNTEEHKIFPLAKAHLTADDWLEIDSAFLANDNPWEGAVGEYAALFSRIVNIAPAPVGLGG
ncbi:hemerythrin domain-containing protein [Dechloromonas sp. XY25]|uniref:Hemerythrin domain-containing protein n=1 Tax=Dechloromonas hankyongensis TaxID=2908002 RepID=A0ABS9K233_9RHOO|nr:hemerythrin domain-containing protein [Dechloromonas hankyongensis]MCG2577217.1 hemerythrin domain-containing protein [Dechloromonas hankyongensis]